MPGKKPRPILPAIVKASRLSEGPGVLLRKRQAISRLPTVAYACFQCRQAKAKCSGAKPKCARCLTRKLECDYDDDDIARLRLDDLRKRCREVSRVNENLQALLLYLTQQPEIDAIGILQRLRTTDNPMAVAESLRLGDSMMQKRVDSVPKNECEELRLIDQEALAGSPIKVPALPWTSIAGDGIVSELISSFITFEHTFLFSFVDRDAFLEDMRHNPPQNTQYCSSLLVNAICSLRSVRLTMYSVEIGGSADTA
ncbi:Notoamide biosynthesis transcriptional activator notL' [Paramyrothecium foliicola]|nr:Notoamide biosynthesis transcriptional activator notL' [Paramyrothecium foliicola]